MSVGFEEITPPDSVVPVYLGPEPALDSTPPSHEEQIEEQNTLRSTAIQKLMSLGLTRDEALTLVGQGQ